MKTQMFAVRMDCRLVRRLERVAKQQITTVGALIRQGAANIVDAPGLAAVNPNGRRAAKHRQVGEPVA